MTIEIESLAVIPDYVHPSDLFDVTIDISTWLGADTIASAVLSAVDEDGDDATTTVLGTGSNTNTVITVNLKGGGTHDVKYMIKIGDITCQIQTIQTL